MLGFIFFNEGFDGESLPWYSGTDESFSGVDLYTITLHELGHVLGIGTIDTWWNNVSGDYFYGKNAVASYGGPVPLYMEDGGSHWFPAEGLNGGVESTLLGTEIRQASAYGPFYAAEGTRWHLTYLDLAGLQDIGWATVVPEPATIYMLLSGLGIVGLGVHRRRRAA